MTDSTARRPKRSLKLFKATEEFFGYGRTQTYEIVKRGLLHPYRLPGGRTLLVTEDEIVELQERAMKASAAEREA
jgi:hypothetical protein